MGVYTIDKDFLNKHIELFKQNVEFFLYQFEKKRYEEFTILDLHKTREIMYDALISAKIIASNENSIDNITDCIQTQEFQTFDINILKEVPDSIIIKLYEYVNIASKSMKEYFPIDNTTSGRYDTVIKGVIYQIKLLYVDHFNNLKNNIFHELKIKDYISPIPMEKRIELIYDKLINDSILWCKCYEADDKDSDMCREILHQDVKLSYKYLNHLEPNIDNHIKKEIKFFLDIYENKHFDTDYFDKKTLFKNSKHILLETLKEAEKDIDLVMENNNLFDTKAASIQYDTYTNLFKNSRDRFKSSQKISAFLKELRKTNMNYIMPYQDTTIYPFLYDLIVMSFIYSLTYKHHEKEFNDIQHFAKKINDTKEKYLSKNSNENYYYYELIRSVELIPNEYKSLDPVTILIKHYSEILNCKYNTIANIFRQLQFDFADNYKSEYALPKHLINHNLNFDDDHFRKLSLYII